MKTLGKLTINSGKKLKDEELLVLRGGDFSCFCYGGNMNMTCYGIMASANPGNCFEDCHEAGYPTSTWNNFHY